jgi:hypothetical protein
LALLLECSKVLWLSVERSNNEGAVQMILAVRTSKCEAIKLQLSSLLGVRSVDIANASTSYLGIALLNLNDTDVSTENSIRNIEALQLDEPTASELQNPIEAEGMPSSNSLKSVASVEQYEHLSHLLYIHKSKRHQT